MSVLQSGGDLGRVYLRAGTGLKASRPGLENCLLRWVPRFATVVSPEHSARKKS